MWGGPWGDPCDAWPQREGHVMSCQGQVQVWRAACRHGVTHLGQQRLQSCTKVVELSRGSADACFNPYATLATARGLTHSGGGGSKQATEARGSCCGMPWPVPGAGGSHATMPASDTRGPCGAGPTAWCTTWVPCTGVMCPGGGCSSVWGGAPRLEHCAGLCAACAAACNYCCAGVDYSGSRVLKLGSSRV